MHFSILVETNPDAPALAKLAEERGFSGIFLIDSHMDWREVYPYLTLCANGTSRIRIGTLVTNPVTRHPTVTASAFATLHEISGGRMVMGIARGDSSVRALGERQATIAEFRERAGMIRRLVNGESVAYTPKQPGKEKWLAQSGGGTRDVRLSWYSSPGKLPLYIGGYGPRILEVAGELADAIVVQAPDLEILNWSLARVRRGSEKAGRAADSIRPVVAGPILVDDDRARARDDLRWFVQAVWNHSADLVARYDAKELPKNLVLGLPKDFRSDYTEHVKRHAEELKQVPDEAVDALTVAGPAESCIEQIRELEKAGAQEFIVYALAMPKTEIEELIGTLSDQIIPRFQ